MDENKVEIRLDYQFRDVVICALRYALPRHTYIVDEICEWVEKHSEILDDRMLIVMKRDVEEQLAYYDEHGVSVIDEIDYKRIRRFYDWLMMQL